MYLALYGRRVVIWSSITRITAARRAFSQYFSITQCDGTVRRRVSGHSRTISANLEQQGARFGGVRLLAEERRALSWPKTETNLDAETVLAGPPSVLLQVRMAEDARFELARACTQHAFQACALGH